MGDFAYDREIRLQFGGGGGEAKLIVIPPAQRIVRAGAGRQGQKAALQAGAHSAGVAEMAQVLQQAIGQVDAAAGMGAQPGGQEKRRLRPPVAAFQGREAARLGSRQIQGRQGPGRSAQSAADADRIARPGAGAQQQGPGRRPSMCADRQGQAAGIRIAAGGSLRQAGGEMGNFTACIGGTGSLVACIGRPLGLDGRRGRSSLRRPSQIAADHQHPRLPSCFRDAPGQGRQPIAVPVRQAEGDQRPSRFCAHGGQVREAGHHAAIGDEFRRRGGGKMRTGQEAVDGAGKFPSLRNPQHGGIVPRPDAQPGRIRRGQAANHVLDQLEFTRRPSRIAPAHSKAPFIAALQGTAPIP